MACVSLCEDAGDGGKYFEQRADDGENDDGEDGHDDAAVLLAYLPCSRACWEGVPRPCIHGGYHGLHHDGRSGRGVRGGIVVCGGCAVFAVVRAIGGDVAMVCALAEVGCESEAWTLRS